jgi:hypothetical protein
VYCSNETTGEMEKTEVYVRPFPEVNTGKWQVSTGGGNTPVADHEETYFFGLSPVIHV